jgi:multiple sugar transport system substrate-binding protein
MEPDGTGVWHDLVRQFHEKNPDLQVQLVEGPASTDTREDMYSTAFLAGEWGYDVVFSDVIWTPKFAAANWLLDLTDRLAAADRQDFLPADLHAGMYRGRLYRIPALTDAGILYYRKDLVPEPPATTEQLLAYGRENKVSNRWTFVWQGKQYEGLVTFFLEVLWGYGGDWIDPQTRAVHLDEHEASLALNFMVNLIRERMSPPGVTTYSEEETRNLFQSGHALFLRNWLYVWELSSHGNGLRRDQIAFAPMVHDVNQPGVACLGGWGFAISRFTTNPEGAWRLVEFLTRPDALAEVRRRAGPIAARRSQVPSEFLPVLLNARSRPAIPEYAQASDILQRWLSAALSGRTPPDEALRAAAKETRLLLKSE